ncbi:NTP transferase domain-containing protein [Parasphingorhabdus cellanae]|uniref:Nucleotidyltransferase family protein n=1 Tax=Parasphingorhabdus cellanae TaxID=2806553 RepID=A0ABX7T1Q8_9SPHN|nr:NTP transferase domain-containing protein [Parasphingorhabdus cellanae]QTD54888.1 nucleotidyltransferase family protein [Parasphingorhabdus cellanae]
MTDENPGDAAVLARADAIVLAGSRPGGDAMADSRGIAVKALIPVAGKAMLAHVTDALLSHSAIGNVHLLAQDFKPFWADSDTQGLAANGRVMVQESGATIAVSVDALLKREDARYPLLITTADNVLLSQEMIADFLNAATASDIAIAVVEKDVLLRRYPASRRTWLKLRGGHYSGANLFYFGSPQARQILRYWAEVEQDRKKGWKILTIFGPWLLFLAVTRMLTVDQLAARVGRKLGLTIKIVPMTQAEACIDVDKEIDLAMVEQIIAAQTKVADI